MRARTCILLFLAAALTGCTQQASQGRLRELLSKVVGPSRRQLVRQMFESPDPDKRRSAIEELSDHGWGRKDPYLKAYGILTEDPAPTVRSVALRALGLGGDARYLDKVVAALKDLEPSVRCDAAAALDSIIDPRAIGPLSTTATTDPVADVRVAAARALRHYRQKEVLETLLRCLRDPEFSVRYRAGESLGELTGETAAPELAAWRKVLSNKDDPFARSEEPRNWWQRWRARWQKRPTSRPAAGASASGKPKRPWWDWFGVTRSRHTTTAPAGS